MDNWNKGLKFLKNVQIYILDGRDRREETVEEYVKRFFIEKEFECERINTYLRKFPEDYYFSIYKKIIIGIPDFIIYRKEDEGSLREGCFKFVEVKRMEDSVHNSQIKWYLENEDVSIVLIWVN